jgi:hypothetical protein
LNLKLFCEGIGLDSAAQQQTYAYRMGEEEYKAHKKQFYADRYSYFESVKQTTGYRKLLLYLKICGRCL